MRRKQNQPLLRVEMLVRQKLLKGLIAILLLFSDTAHDILNAFRYIILYSLKNMNLLLSKF